jgi:hypothetical protein
MSNPLKAISLDIEIKDVIEIAMDACCRSQNLHYQIIGKMVVINFS